MKEKEKEEYIEIPVYAYDGFLALLKRLEGCQLDEETERLSNEVKEAMENWRIEIPKSH